VSEAEHAFLFALHVPALPAAGPAVLASVTVAYDAVTDEIHPREVPQDLGLCVLSREKAAIVSAEASVICQLLDLRAAWALEAAIAQTDRGGITGALAHLQAFLAIPEVAAATDPEIQAAAQRVQHFLHQLAAEGFTRMRRKQMRYSSYRWTTGKAQPSAEPTGDRA
jgi:hypothetical protein